MSRKHITRKQMIASRRIQRKFKGGTRPRPGPGPKIAMQPPLKYFAQKNFNESIHPEELKMMVTAGDISRHRHNLNRQRNIQIERPDNNRKEEEIDIWGPDEDPYEEERFGFGTKRSPYFIE